MKNNRLFQTTWWRLASWYAGTMSLIFAACSFGLYEAIVHAHRVTIHREMESIAETFRQNLKLHLKESGEFEETVEHLFPSFCSNNLDCHLANQEVLESLDYKFPDDYYLEIFSNLNKSLVATKTKPKNLILKSKQGSWTYFKDSQNNRYHQISIVLETINNQPSGYLIVGRSLKDFDSYVASTTWFLIIGFPVALILIVISAWYLSGLAIRPIYSSYQQIQQFTGDAAHELRTPLATIRATIESRLMLAEWDKDDIKRSFASIEKQNERMSILVNDLLILSRIDQGLSNDVNKAANQPVILNDVVDDILEEFAALALEKSINLEIKKNITFPLAIDGNEAQIYRLLANVVINAIQYTPQKGTVKVVLSADNRRAIIEISDTGIGIPKEAQLRIFERFYRVNHDRSRHTGGSGLGLAIAQAIVILHNGFIDVTSELNKGSIFTIRLPYCI
ncbi:MAG: two-component system sensor histidine kinase RppB [Limnothrix sp.]